ncbi:MAG TPA: hypothetical protein VGM74_22205 [Burkholderiaceae bacterium]|jgi:hypothetical protein
MQIDDSLSPAKSLVDAQRRLLNHLRLTRARWREASELGALDSGHSAWSKTEWAETAAPPIDADIARLRDR